MKFPRNAKIFRGQLDVAPFASVFFLLALFMVFSSLLVSSPGVKIKLPALESETAMRVTLPKLDVAVTAEGQIIFEGQVVPQAELRERLRAAVSRFTNSVPSLVLHADQRADLETTLQICQSAVDVGIEQTVVTGRRVPFEVPSAAQPDAQ